MNGSSNDRAFLALILYLRGLDLEGIASRLPRQPGGSGVSERSAEILLRSGLRALLAGIVRGQRPDGLPTEAWPPAAARERIREQCCQSWRSGLSALREWLDHTVAASALDRADSLDVTDEPPR